MRINETPGQTWKFDSTQTTDSNNTGTMNGQTQSVTNKSAQHRTGTSQVLAVANGVPTSMRITFDKSSDSKEEQNGQSQTSSYVYAGETITVTRAADGSITDDFKGQADPDSVADLHSFLDEDAVVIPDHPVNIGDEWPGQPQTVARVLRLTGQDTGGMTMKLLGVRTVDGKSVADVKVSFAINKVNPGMKAQVVMQGTELIDLASGHAIQNDFKGSADISGQQQTQGPDGKPANVDIQGHGTMTMSKTSPFVDGSTVAAAAPEENARPIDNTPPAVNPLGAAPPAPAPVATPDAPFVGTFTDGKLKVQLQPAGDGYGGLFSLNGKNYPVAASLKDNAIAGAFAANGATFPFTATLDGDSIALTTGTATYHLNKAVANPLGVAP